MALDTKMDEARYPGLLLAHRARRVETRASLISSYNAIHDGLLVSSVSAGMSDCRRAVLHGMCFDGDRESTEVLLHLPKQTAYEWYVQAYHSRWKCKEAWHSYLDTTGAYISDCTQVVVVKLASSGALCGGHRPQINQCHQPSRINV